MKRLIIIAFLLISSVIVGQENNEKFKIEKHSWNVEGDLYLFSQEFKNYDDNNSDRDYFGIGFTPKIGYAIKNNLILGIGIGYEYSNSNYRNELTSDGSNSSNTFSVFPYIKKYVPVGEKIAFHFQGEAKFSNAVYNSKNEITYENKRNFLFIGIRPGLSFELSKNILLQANIGVLGYSYSKSKVDDKNDEKFNGFQFKLSSSDLSFGLSIIL